MFARAALLFALIALAGCQRATPPTAANTPSSPTSPTSLLAVPGAPPSAQPFMSIADVQGEWDVTITAGASCQNIPASLRTRTYLVNIGWYSDGKSYKAQLSGSRFFYRDESFHLIPRPGGALFFVSSLYAMETWHEHGSVFERLDAGGYLALMGTAEVSIDSSTATVSAGLAGSLGHCPIATEPGDSIYPPACPNISQCALGGLTLTRR